MSAYDAIEAAIEQCKDDAGADPELLSGALLAEEQLAALCKQIETSQNAVDKLMGDIGRLSIANLEVANLNAALRAHDAEAMEMLRKHQWFKTEDGTAICPSCDAFWNDFTDGKGAAEHKPDCKWNALLQRLGGDASGARFEAPEAKMTTYEKG